MRRSQRLQPPPNNNAHTPPGNAIGDKVQKKRKYTLAKSRKYAPRRRRRTCATPAVAARVCDDNDTARVRTCTATVTAILPPPSPRAPLRSARVEGVLFLFWHRTQCASMMMVVVGGNSASIKFRKTLHALGDGVCVCVCN